MVDGVYLHALQHGQQARVVGNAAQERHALHRRRQAGQLLVDGVQRVLAGLEQHDARRLLPHDLAAQLRANRPARAGDHHHLAADVGRQQRRLRRYRVAAQQVVDADFAQLGHAHLAGHQVGHARQALDGHVQRFQFFQNLAVAATAGRRDGQQDQLGLGVLQQLRQLVRAVHRQATEGTAPQLRVIVHKRHRAVLAPFQQAGHQLQAGAAGAVDQHRAARRIQRVDTPHQATQQKAAAADIGHGEHPEDDDGGARKGADTRHQDHRHQHQHRQRHADKHGVDDAVVQKLQHGAVQAQLDEDGQHP